MKMFLLRLSNLPATNNMTILNHKIISEKYLFNEFHSHIRIQDLEFIEDNQVIVKYSYRFALK